MSLAAAFDELPTRQPTVTCSTCVWLDALDNNDVASFEAARRRGVPMTELHKVAAANGLGIGAKQFAECLRRHHALG